MKIGIFFLLAFVSLLTLTKTEEIPEDYMLSDEIKEVKLEVDTMLYRISIDSELFKAYIRISVLSIQAPLEGVYISKDKTKTNFKDSDYKSIEAKPYLYLSDNYYGLLKEIFVRVKCVKECHYKIAMSYQTDYFIEDNSSLELFLPKDQETVVNYKIPNQEINFQLIVQSEDNDFSLSYIYNEKEFEVNKGFDLGSGIFITNSDYVYKESELMKITIKGSKSLYTITQRVIPEDNITQIQPLDNILVLLKSNSHSFECFTLKETSETNISTSYILNARSYTQNAIVYFSDSTTGAEITPQQIGATGYYRFNANDIESKNLCVKSSDNSALITGLQFQIVNELDLTNSQPRLAPLLNNRITTSYLPKNEDLYYRLKTVKTNKSLVLNLHILKGEPALYGFKLTDYPKQTITPENIIKLKEEKALAVVHDVNDYYFHTVNFYPDPYHSSSQYVAIVHCPETKANESGCVYEILMGNEEEYNHLSQGIRFAQPVQSSTPDYYQFSINDNSIKKLYVFLYSFSGDADLYVSRNKDFKEEIGIYVDSGNKEYYELTNEATEGSPSTLNGQFFIKIKSSSDAYYSIYYLASKETQLTQVDVAPGEIITETLNKADDLKTFTLINRNVDNKANYFATFTALNCKVIIYWKGSTYPNRRTTFTITSNDEEYSSGRYNFQIQLDSLDSGSQSNTDNCLIQITGNEISDDKEITLNEGVVHSMILNSNVNKVIYSYPIAYPDFEGDNEINYIVSFTKLSEGKVKLSYLVQDSAILQSHDVVTPHKKLVINTDNGIRNCVTTNNVCPIILIIEGTGENSIEYLIQVTSINPIPVYLQKEELRLDIIGLYGKQYQYYYQDLALKESGEIVFNFKKKTGLAVAKIVKKNFREKNPNWNKRVLLPIYGAKNNLNYDSFNKKIVFTEKDTEKCTEGCELYIGVLTKEGSDHINEYSIFTRKDESIVHLFENEAVFGSLTQKGQGYTFDYYTIKITSDTDRIILNFIGELCFGYAKLGNEKPNVSNKDWEFDYSNPMFEIQASDAKIGSQSMIGKEITFAVSTRGLEDIYSSFYSFKVITPTKGLPNIVEINSTQEQLSFVTASNGMCYFIIPINTFERINKIHLYAFNEKKSKSSIGIYAKYIKATKYDLLSPTQIEQMLPSKDVSDYSSIKQFETDRLSITLTTTQQLTNCYLLVAVQSHQIGKLTVLTNFYAPSFTTYLKANTKELFSIYSSQNIQFIGDNYYYLEIVRLEGEAKINDISWKNYVLNEKQKSMAIVIQPSTKNPQITIEPKTQTAFLFYAYYSIRSSENFDEISYSRLNIVNYYETFFPSIYYMRIENEDNDISINVKLSQYQYKDGNNLGDDAFIVQGLITDSDFIIKRKKNSSINPEATEVITGEFNQPLRMVQLTFKSALIKKYITKGIKYTYISIKQADTNKHAYRKIATNVIALSNKSVENRLSLPSDQYYYGSIGEPNEMITIQLNKNNGDQTQMEVEYSSSNNFAVTFNPITDSDSTIDYSKNTSSIITKTAKENGKSIVLLDVSKIDKSIAVSISSLSLIGYFALKYQCGGQNDEFKHLTIRDRKITIEKSKMEVKATFKSITDSEGDAVPIDYYLNFYSTNNKTHLEAIYVNQQAAFVEKKENAKSDDEIGLVSSRHNNGEFYVNVIAVSRQNGFEEILVYEPTLITTIKDPFPIWGIVLICCGAVVIIGLVLLLIFLYLRLKQKSQSLKSEYKIIKEVNSDPLITDD